MFFHGIGIDLHFVYEGDVNSPDVSHIFNNYRHAGSKLRPDSSTRIGAFLLNEVDRTVPVLYNTPQGENVVLHTGHTCDSGRFLARVWRIRSLIDAAWGANDTEADEVILRAIRSGAPGQDAQTLYESRPVKFSAYKPSVWVDAGLISEFPACDVSIVVKRPSTQQTITAIFKYTKSPGFLTQFPGEPISSFGSNASLNPRHVNAGSEDERQLDQFIEAFISKTRLDDVPVPASMSNAAAQTASPGASTRDDAPRSSQNTSPILAEQSVDSRDNNLCRAFNTSSPAPSEAHNGEEANTGDKAKAISSVSSTASEDTLPLRSPPLAHRAWASISNIVSSRTTSHTASKHSRASSVAPSNSFATNEPQAEEETAPTQITETRASSPCESESDEAHHKNLTTLIKDITTLLDDATDAFDEHKWADTAVQTDSEDDGFEKGDSNVDAGHMASESVRAGRSGAMVVEYGTQTEHSCCQAQVVGVSCPEQATGSISRGQAGDAMQECQPLVLPVGSVTTSESSGGAATATTTAEQPAVRVDNDVEMADVEATTSHATNAGTQPAQTLGDDHAPTATLQPENGAQDAGQIQAAQAQSSATQSTPIDVDKENQSPAQGSIPTMQVATDDDMQFILCSRSEEPRGTFIETGLRRESMASRSMSEMPLAELFTNVERNLDPETASALGAMIRSGSSAYGGGSMRSHSTAPSTSSRSSFNPSTQRLSQLLEYLMSLMANDKMKDDMRCQQLTELRERFSHEYEQAKAAYDAKLAQNNLAMHNARTTQMLKKDTIRLLRASFRFQVADSRFQRKTGAESRMGSDRRGRSMSRATSTARSSRAPSVVPASRIKRERIVLTGDGVMAPRSRAASMAPTGHRAMSISRSVGGNLGSGRSENGFKVGDINDLLRPMPVQQKRSGSHVGSRAGTPAPQGVVNVWLNHVKTGRAGTPASPVPRSVVDSELMPPPRLPFAPGALPSSPVVIDGDRTRRPRASSTRASSTVGKNRSARAASVASNVSAASKMRRPQAARAVSRQSIVAPSAGHIAHEVVEDSSDDDDDTLFLGSRSRASSVSTNFTVLHD